MPQMAPISWLSLFMIFSIILIMFNVMNYYNIFPTTPKSKNDNKPINYSLNWKW